VQNPQRQVELTPSALEECRGRDAHTAFDTQHPTNRDSFHDDTEAVSPWVRCILAPPGKVLFGIMCGLFEIHLIIEGELETWTASVGHALLADFLCCVSAILLLLITVALVVCGVYMVRRPAIVLLLALSGSISSTVLWYLLLVICNMHNLEILSLGDTTFGLRQVVNCWQWVPIGVFRSTFSIVWRPWWITFYVLPSFLWGGHSSESCGWCCMREVLIGYVFWMCLFIVFISVWRGALRNMDAPFGAFAILTLALLYISYILTCAPIARFWAFLLDPWWRLIQVCARGDKLNISATEWAVFFVTLWAEIRNWCIALRTCQHHLGAIQRMDRAFNDAISNPFVASLEHGFGERLHQSFELAVIQPSDDGLQEDLDVQSLNLAEKQDKVINARQNALVHGLGGVGAAPAQFQFRISRARILEDSVDMLLSSPTYQLLVRTLMVSFEGEAGVDGGGLCRDWFDAFATALTEGADNLSSGSSSLVVAQDQTLVPRPVTGEMEEVRLRALFAIGRFLALAVLRKQPVPLSFNLVTYKHLLGIPVGMDDVRRLDPEFYRYRIQPVLDRDGLQNMESILGEPLKFMSAPTALHPSPIELCEGGGTLAVTEGNKVMYVKLLCEAHLCGSFRKELSCILKGFWEVLPLGTMQRCGIGPGELSLMISGVKDVDPVEWQLCSSEGDTDVHQWFWETVREFSSEQRCALLHFATGSSRLPPGGINSLDPPFSVDVIETSTSAHLPHAHTCANKVVLHRYSSKDQLRDKLVQAIVCEGFGFA